MLVLRRMDFALGESQEPKMRESFQIYKNNFVCLSLLQGNAIDAQKT
jgi:hypothetical protein